MEHYSTGRVYQTVRGKKKGKRKKEELQKLNQNEPGQHIYIYDTLRENSG